MVAIQVDYDFYHKEFKGDTIPSTLFDKYIEYAHLDLFNVIAANMYDIQEDELELIERIKKCECSLADFEYKYGIDKVESDEDGTNVLHTVGEVKSESAGSVSRTYVTDAEIFGDRNKDIAVNPEKYKLNIIRRYLGNTGLLYRGMGYV